MSPEEYRVKLEKKVKYWKDAVDRIHTVLQDTQLGESERLAKATATAVDAKLIPEDREF